VPNFKQLVFSLSSLAFVLFIVLPSAASAQGVNDFVINNFDANYTLSNEDPQGYLEITESIELTYDGQNRGIVRTIPSTYKSADLHMKVLKVMRDGVIEPYITYEENGNTILQIGDAATYITGQHTYKISYSLENVISFYDEYDEIYWDINGDQWLQIFQSVSVDLDVDATSKSGVVAECFTGSFGSTEDACAVKQLTNGLMASSTRSLQPGETLTIVQAYEKGFFTPPTFWDKYGHYLLFTPVVIVQLAVLHWGFRRWKALGKDYKSRGVTAPYFDRPKNISLMQAQYIKENKLSPKHISASIIDLSIRGYLKISEQKEGRATTHSLELMNLPNKNVFEDEIILLEGLFSTLDIGNIIKLEDKKNKLFKTSEKIAKHIDNKNAEQGYYELSPKKAFNKIAGPFVASIAGVIFGFILADVSGGLTALVGLVAFGGVLIFGFLMPKRSVSGNMIVEHMDGLKLYLSKAEKDRMEMQDAVAAPLSPQSGQPTRDVKFFEKLLPFAVAAGVEKTWANAFKDIYTQPPEWYSGNWSTFSTVALASSLSNTAKITTQSFAAPSSSGSSGSGGGGFSGGGGGGGGGGGW
jgi:uncharacterized membrane protein YgcG